MLLIREIGETEHESAWLGKNEAVANVEYMPNNEVYRGHTCSRLQKHPAPSLQKF